MFCVSVSASIQVGLLSYSHQPSPLFPLNGSHDLGIILQKIRDIPYVDPSGNNLGEDCNWHGPLGLPHQELWCLGVLMHCFSPGTAVITAHRHLLAPNAPGRRQQVPGVMVVLVDEPLRGDIFSPIREAQTSGELWGCRSGALETGPVPVRLSCRSLDLFLGLKVMMLGLAGADPEQLRRLAPGVDPIRNFFATDNGPSLDRAVSDLAVALCQAAVTVQVWTRPLGTGGGQKTVGFF